MQEFFRAQQAKGGPVGPGGPFWPREDFNAPNGHGIRHYPDFVREQFAEGAERSPDGKMWPKPTFMKLMPGDGESDCCPPRCRAAAMPRDARDAGPEPDSVTCLAAVLIMGHTPHAISRCTEDQPHPRVQCYFRCTSVWRGKGGGDGETEGVLQVLCNPWLDWPPVAEYVARQQQQDGGGIAGAKL